MDVRNLAHFIWIGDSGLPPLYSQCIDSFARKHPGWRIKLWLSKDVDKIIAESKYDFNKYTSFINRYNFIKYHILAKEGGWFVDLDIEWKLSIDQIYSDKLRNTPFPDLFVPVRSFPTQPVIDIKANDDMLIYARQGIFYELLEFINSRENIDTTRKYEPYGPISLSQWIHNSKYSKIFLYENEIQQNGYYCDHKNNLSWKFS